MTVALASVGVEFQGLVRIITTLIGDAGLDLLGVATADARQVGWVGGVGHNGQDAGRSLVGGNEAGEGDEGQGEGRFLEEHVDGLDQNKGIDNGWMNLR